MVPEHGRRAWVLGQGQAATGTNTHSTSCRQQRASQSPPGGSTCFLAKDADLKGGVPSGALHQSALGPLGTGASAPVPGPLPSWGLLGVKQQVEGRWLGWVCPDCPPAATGIASPDPGLGSGVTTGWGQSTAQVTPIQGSGSAEGPSLPDSLAYTFYHSQLTDSLPP